MRKEFEAFASKRDCPYQELIKNMSSVFKELEPSSTIISIPKNSQEN